MTRQVTVLRDGWLFRRGEDEAGRCPAGSEGWEAVRVPHDWAIAGPFDEDNDAQVTAILEDGEHKPAKHTGRTGSLPHVGVAWYRLELPVREDLGERRVWAEFDGVMSRSTVYVNGEQAGRWPFGYASFVFDVTDLLRVGAPNELAVRVDNPPNASRWYPGAGIYRHVRLVVVVDPVHVAHWGTYVTTPQVSAERATVHVRTELEGQAGAAVEAELRTLLLDPDGREVGEAASAVSLDGTATVEQEIEVAQPALWGPDEPRLYRAVSRVSVGSEPRDEYETVFGIRELRFDRDEGFFVNGARVQLKGVCMHHDLGALGTAINVRALERQVEMLREMGCNAIRTSHNPPAPELLELCDRMGLVVIDEAFDEWRAGKVDNGYHTLFDEWAERDLRAMIRRDRNHPCVIMWSIGNEIREQAEADGAEVARSLTDICHDEDPTRPVTAGLNQAESAIEKGLADAVDAPGWNYRPHHYAQFRQAHPDWTMYASETESCVSSRGEYYFPVEEERGVCRATGHVSSYDMAAPPWGCSPDREFAAQQDHPYMLGQFTWTGWDYLGEPTPYNLHWPSRSSYFGIIDLAGFPKDRFWLYRSHWSGSPTLHVLPHWTWPGREGEVTSVHCYTSWPAAELFVNGASQGARSKDSGEEYGRSRLRWDEVRYEPGELRVVALAETGAPVQETFVRTAGAPARIELGPDRDTIRSDGLDLSFITARIVDAAGTLCPHADNQVEFTIVGPAELAGVDNGDQTSVESFQAPRRKAFHGLCLVIVRSVAGQGGAVTVRATSEGPTPAECAIRTGDA